MIKKCLQQKLMKKSILILFPLLLVACSSTPPHSGKFADQIYTLTSLQQQYQKWQHTPYRLGGNSHKGIDCSAFVMRTFAERFLIHLPRTTAGQVKVGRRITKDQLQSGDLVFFKTGRGPNGYHVGIYVNDGKFLHASTRYGVTYSSLNNPYWKKVFWQARRV